MQSPDSGLSTYCISTKAFLADLAGLYEVECFSRPKIYCLIFGFRYAYSADSGQGNGSGQGGWMVYHSRSLTLMTAHQKLQSNLGREDVASLWLQTSSQCYSHRRH